MNEVSRRHLFGVLLGVPVALHAAHTVSKSQCQECGRWQDDWIFDHGRQLCEQCTDELKDYRDLSYAEYLVACESRGVRPISDDQWMREVLRRGFTRFLQHHHGVSLRAEHLMRAAPPDADERVLSVLRQLIAEGW